MCVVLDDEVVDLQLEEDSGRGLKMICYVAYTSRSVMLSCIALYNYQRNPYIGCIAQAPSRTMLFLQKVQQNHFEFSLKHL